MKKTNFTFLIRQKEKIFLFVMLTLFSALSGGLFAQCSLACNTSTQVSLDQDDCEAEITYQMILTDLNSCPGGSFVVTVMDLDNNVIPTSPVVNSDHVGETLIASVMDTNSGNSCWGYIVIEDKLAPVIVCEDPDPFFCYELIDYEPTVTDNCDNPVDLQLLSETITTNDCNGIYGPEILKVINRTYIAVDLSGNVSDECEIQLVVNRIPSLGDIVPPASLLLADGTALDCQDDFSLVPSSVATGGTGVPTYNGIDLFPDPDLNCNLLVTYDDTELPPVGCVTKIMRMWTVFEWSCDNPQRDTNFVQMIEIVDDNGPTFTCPSDFETTTNGHECEASVWLPPLTDLGDPCDSPVTVDIAYPGGFLQDQNGGHVFLEPGMNEITYTAYDECFNATSCTIVVTVADHTPPVAICDQNTVISVTSDGYAWVHASVFDDGSYDECELERMLVRRMDDGCTTCDPPTFSDFHYLGTLDGSYYYLSSDSLTIGLAAKHAEALGGKLLSTETEAEHNFVHEQVIDIYPGNMYWLGLNDVQSEGDFRWASGNPLIYTNWAIGAPALAPNNIMDYVIVRQNGTWNDVASTNREERYVVEITDPCGWSEYVRFCCSDIGDEDLMVSFRVVDNSCNYNDCMVNAVVQDKLSPTVVCPADLTLDCDFTFDENDLDGAFGVPTVYDNCGYTLTQSIVDNRNSCGIGTVERTITATDDGGRESTCIQTIDFVNNEPFNINGDDIIWPDDVDMDGCADPNSVDFHPDNTGYPTLIEDVCDLVGATWDDQIYPFNNAQGNACFKIIRVWTVIDWCQFNNGVYPEWNWSQIIKVTNSEDPVITSDCSRVTTCTFDENCQSGFIELTADATDDCTEELDWSFTIDLDNDGSFDFIQGLNTNGEGNTATASFEYPVGSHRILWSFADKCGNVTTCEQLFDIVNCKLPTPYCLNGLAVDLMPVDTDNDGEVDWGMVELWASDFDNGSYHPCGYEVLLSFSADTSDRNRVFDCNTLGEVDVEMYATVVTPDGQLLQSYCSTFIDVQDNMGACTGNLTLGRIAGNVSTENSDMVEEVSVALEGSPFNDEMTDEVGSYAFPEMPTGGAYTVNPKKNNDPKNGISTLDMVLIQRHILGLQSLDSPYKIIAADITNDKDVSGADIVTLRKLILNKIHTFPDNESWRFIDGNYEFTNPNEPLNEAFPEEYVISDFDNDMTIDFTAIKVGDVNGSVDTHNLSGVDTDSRNDLSLDLEITNVTLEENENISIPVKVTEEQQLTGFQFTLSYDVESLEFESITSEVLEITEENLGLSRLNNGIISVSWHDSYGVSLGEAQSLFDLNFVSKTNDNLEKLVSINSALIDAEAYNHDLEEMPISISFRGATVDAVVLHQNIPNPFNHKTVIGVDMPYDADASLTVFDMTGKVLVKIDENLTRGYNKIEINQSLLSQSGVLYYQLETEGYVETKKMIVLK